MGFPATSPDARPWIWATAFAVVAVAVYLVCSVVVATKSFAASPGTVGVAVALDLAVVLPLAYYFLLVRGAALPAISTVMVFLVGALLAASLLPSGHPGLQFLALAALPAEVLLLGVLAYKTRGVVRAYRQSAARNLGFPEALSEAVRTTLGSSWPARALASEVAFLYFAFVPRRRPTVPAGAGTYTCHQESGWGAICLALFLVVATEVVAIHLLVSQWSDAAAWALSGLGIYGLLWLLADYRAMTLRPILLTEQHLLLRIGMRWAAEIPLAAIATVRRAAPTDRAAGRAGRAERGYLRVTAVGDPHLVLELRRPIEVSGLLGMSHKATSLGIAVDGNAFAIDLEQAMAAVETDPDSGVDSPKPPVSREAASLPSPKRALLAMLFPVRRSQRTWWRLNSLFLAAQGLVAAGYAAYPAVGDRMVGELLSSGATKVILDEMAAGGTHAVLPALIFANNFAVVIVGVVAASLLVPFAGIASGLILAVPLGLGLGFALASGAGLGMIAVVPVVLFEQFAVVMGMLFAWWSGQQILQARRGGAGWWEARRKSAREIWPTAAAIAFLLVLGAVAEAALLFAVDWPG